MQRDNFDFDGLLTQIKRSYTPFRKVIQNSWKRSSDYGIKTDEFSASQLLDQNRAAEKIAKYRDELDKFDFIFDELNQIMENIAAAFLITDEEGYILSVKNHLEDFLDIRTGDNWSEFHKGTSAVGLTLFTKNPSHVIGNEHFKNNLTELNSAAYPILNKDSELLGVVGAFSPAEINIDLLKLIIHIIGLTLTEKTPIDTLISKQKIKSSPKIGSRVRYDFSSIVTESEKMYKAIEVAKIAARNDSTVMLVGSSGTGKEMFAQAIHNYNYRRNRPFVAINVGAVPKDLVESEFFGYEDGAFTGAIKGGKPGKFELANGGTIFLDEIGEMSLSAQQNLLRVIQEKEVTRIGGTRALPIDVRIITATKKNLLKEVEKGNFREDLYYRLNVITIPLPELKERKEDIKLLTENFIKKHCHKFGIPSKKLHSNTLEYLINYDWPGNVRELENMLEGVITFAMDEEIIKPKHLPKEIRKKSTKKTDEAGPMSLEEMEKKAVINALKKSGQNLTKAAEILGITRATLYNKIDKYQIKIGE
ncbi:sigma-54-dependent Fis family transcriptional regulator [Halanaerobium sp. MA284_MarDTE_T2]|uniref:sigma-54 interaction domain-containing protein n=1 Tax=Halanaerobium sp. MA284_MarDTE_T2 TaxID=2183913 RepID=UPI000DF133D9|nr:sigma 54-interacting transcriptional regulator [Halanaerobium sp. MA284_MarDTE_T2]RCW48753.1 transcriptional regulator with PAS, ATPase and Fis domain [Halanaerobium sp. MA284_MarDTE_T2]